MRTTSSFKLASNTLSLLSCLTPQVVYFPSIEVSEQIRLQHSGTERLASVTSGHVLRLAALTQLASMPFEMARRNGIFQRQALCQDQLYRFFPKLRCVGF